MLRLCGIAIRDDDTQLLGSLRESIRDAATLTWQDCSWNSSLKFQNALGCAKRRIEWQKLRNSAKRGKQLRAVAGQRRSGISQGRNSGSARTCTRDIYPNIHESCVYMVFWYRNISFCYCFSIVSWQLGGRSSMGEWLLTATLGDLRRHWVTTVSQQAQPSYIHMIEIISYLLQ